MRIDAIGAVGIGQIADRDAGDRRDSHHAGQIHAASVQRHLSGNAAGGRQISRRGIEQRNTGDIVRAERHRLGGRARHVSRHAGRRQGVLESQGVSELMGHGGERAIVKARLLRGGHGQVLPKLDLRAQNRQKRRAAVDKRDVRVGGDFGLRENARRDVVVGEESRRFPGSTAGSRRFSIPPYASLICELGTLFQACAASCSSLMTPVKLSPCTKTFGPWSEMK